jgi:predicted GIY-YIG superfamily endonuclease
MYIYLLKSEENGYYKIGKSVNPDKRVKTLQTGNPEKISLISKVEISNKFCYRVESALHSQYSYVKKNGEWFNLSLEDELLFESNAKRIENNLLILEKEKNHFL